jgi:septum formation protein
MSNSILYLASSSLIRQQILRQAEISFTVIRQSANEEAYLCSNIDDCVLAIAQAKLTHAHIPDGVSIGQIAYVLSADSLVQSSSGIIFGKPKKYEHAVSMLKELRKDLCRIVTGFCCAQMMWNGTQWQQEQLICQAVDAHIKLDISDQWIGIYLNKKPEALNSAGAFLVEEYGAQFIASIQGSYTTILGLPIYEVRKTLEKMGFYCNK